MTPNPVLRWFDPNARYREAMARHGAVTRPLATDETSGAPTPSPPSVLVQYLVFSAGVFVSPMIRQYRTTQQLPQLTPALVGAALFALITGFALFPRAADTIARPDAPTFTRLSTIFTAGLGWEQLSGLPAALMMH